MTGLHGLSDALAGPDDTGNGRVLGLRGWLLAPRHGPWKSPSLALAQTGRLPFPTQRHCIAEILGREASRWNAPAKRHPSRTRPHAPDACAGHRPCCATRGAASATTYVLLSPCEARQQGAPAQGVSFRVLRFKYEKGSNRILLLSCITDPLRKRGEEKERWGERGEKTEEGPGPETAAGAGRWGGGHGGRALLSEGKAPAPSHRRAPHRTASPSSTSGHPVKSECHVSVK